MISKSVTGKQLIRTLVRNATNPYLKIEDNALQTVERLLRNSIENMILIERHVNNNPFPHLITSAR